MSNINLNRQLHFCSADYTQTTLTKVNLVTDIILPRDMAKIAATRYISTFVALPMLKHVRMWSHGMFPRA